MSLSSLEKEILSHAKLAFRNPKLRLKDVLEWSNAECKPQEGEVSAIVMDCITVVISAANDNRTAEDKE